MNNKGSKGLEALSDRGIKESYMQYRYTGDEREACLSEAYHRDEVVANTYYPSSLSGQSPVRKSLEEYCLDYYGQQCRRFGLEAYEAQRKQSLLLAKAFQIVPFHRSVPDGEEKALFTHYLCELLAIASNIAPGFEAQGQVIAYKDFLKELIPLSRSLEYREPDYLDQLGIIIGRIDVSWDYRFQIWFRWNCSVNSFREIYFQANKAHAGRAFDEDEDNQLTNT